MDFANYISDVIALLREHSLYNGDARFTRIVAELREDAGRVQNWGETFDAVNAACKKLDGHGGLSSPGRIAALRSAPVHKVCGKRLKGFDGVAYVKIPGFQGNDEQGVVWASQAHNLIRRLENGGAKSWVLDLRWNGGGNAGPILAALGPFWDQGVLGSFLFRNYSDQWIYKEGVMRFSCSSLSWRVTQPYELKDKNSPIIILTGRQTESSGEFLALIFKSMPNAKLVGEDTRGLSNIPLNFPLNTPEGPTLLHVTTGISVDRYGQKFGGILHPHEYFPQGAYVDEPSLGAVQHDRLVAHAAKLLVNMHPERCHSTRPTLPKPVCGRS